jgi:serine/threonine-protein kinase
MPDVLDRLKTALADRYAIERPLGQGGMATVYLARDLRHDRDVALKVLRPELAAILGAERFLHEIKTTAHLQHPHILPLHDSGEAAGNVFYVMPYVEGESLRDRLNREKQLPVDDAVRIAREVASALDYAHRHGVVHRDIKPENILLHEGQALVVDFGIALAVSRSDGGTRMTETGMSLGTPHYMAPEQAMGDREITPRADVYALGCVLYEMLSGDPPFTGSTAQAIVARVLTEQPRALSLQRRTIPPQIEAATLRALEKLPADRFATAAELAQALVNPGFATSSTTPVSHAAPAPTRDRAPRALVLATVAIAAAGLGALVVWAAIAPWKRPANPRIVRFSFEAVLSPRIGAGSAIAVSPASGDVVFVGVTPQGALQLVRRPLDGLDAIPIAGTTANLLMHPTFSPDGSEIAHYGDQQLRTVPVAGGTPRTIAPMAPRSWGIGWGPGDLLVYSPAAGAGLMAVTASGGDPRPLTTLDTAAGDVDHRWPQVLPDGKSVLFTVWRGSRQANRVALASLKTGRVRELIGGSFGRYAAGELVYVAAQGGVRRVGLDPESGELRGRPVNVADSVEIHRDGSAEFALSETGTLALIGATTGRTPVMVDRDGRATAVLLPEGAYEAPRFSSDGRFVAWQYDNGIWAYDFELGTHGLVNDAGFYPVWTRDGRRIFFSKYVGPDVHVFTIPVDRAEEARAVVEARGQFRVQDISPDGRRLLLRVNEAVDSAGTVTLGQYDLWSLSLDSGAVPERWAGSEALERSATFSPDGRWVAYSADESGRDEIYVRAFPGPGGRVRVSVEGGTEPAWSRGGGELFFRSGDRFEVVSVETRPTFRVLSRPRTLFRGRYYAYPWQRQYDLHPDGRRVVALEMKETDTRITVIADWLSGVRAQEARR